jgi:putative sugar O-methyltransferase
MPTYGNQIGAFIGKNFVVIGSFLNQIYAQNLSNYLNNEKNTIIELGGGYGKFAFYILKNTKKFTYIDFDIPETLTLGSYYLSKCFPNKKNFFYGEKEFNKKIEDDKQEQFRRNGSGYSS